MFARSLTNIIVEILERPQNRSPCNSGTPVTPILAGIQSYIAKFYFETFDTCLVIVIIPSSFGGVHNMTHTHEVTLDVPDTNLFCVGDASPVGTATASLAMLRSWGIYVASPSTKWFIRRLSLRHASRAKNNNENLGKELKIDLDEITGRLDQNLKKPISEQEEFVPPRKDFMSFRRLKDRLDEEAKNRKLMAGKARIGGEWELLNTEGKMEGSKDLIGKWVLMYFGFTNCPDICPDEIEKMVDVVDQLDREKDAVPIVPVFITVDPERDTPDRVKRYCKEFSPKIRGYTGSKEQVESVLKTFRIYHSQGPSDKNSPEDYIVDHTVMMYLIDPEGNFFDYYGQNRRASEIANIVRTKVLQYDRKKKVSWL